ncbi:N-methyl-L-tryptophan oxidase [Armatimonas sp.]|uniref:N-methyl-L-tryptophan oxidase n=1 Tax=Armatimonas sp. TaxID=1872638 RepID=UPI0037528B86
MRVAVVGIGAVGSAACRFLAEAGHTVVGFERFTIGHGLGSSHGESRIIRYAYPEAHYTKLMGQAYPLWDALEQAAGEELFVRCGGLTFGPKEHPELASTRRALEVNRVPHQLLRPEEISERFPAIQLFADEIAIWQSDAGFLRAGAIVRAQARLAEKSGAEMRENTVIESLTELSGFDHVIVCAGAWANTLFPESPLPLTVTRQQVTYLSGELVGYPVWIDMATYWYGFPSDGRIPGVKLARHVPAEVFAPDHPDRPTLESDDDAALAYAVTRLPSLGPEIMHHASCLYTNTPDESFVFDHPRPKITRISACSGHGFKFSILMGKLAAEAATK